MGKARNRTTHRDRRLGNGIVVGEGAEKGVLDNAPAAVVARQRALEIGGRAGTRRSAAHRPRNMHETGPAEGGWRRATRGLLCVFVQGGSAEAGRRAACCAGNYTLFRQGWLWVLVATAIHVLCGKVGGAMRGEADGERSGVQQH